MLLIEQLAPDRKSLPRRLRPMSDTESRFLENNPGLMSRNAFAFCFSNLKKGIVCCLFFQPDTPDGTFPRFFGSSSPIDLEKSPRTVFAKGQAKLQQPCCVFKRANQICPCQCQFCLVLSSRKKESKAKTCPIFCPSHNVRRSLMFDIRANPFSNDKAKLRFFCSLFFCSLKGRQQLLHPGFIMSKRKLIGY